MNEESPAKAGDFLFVRLGSVTGIGLEGGFASRSVPRRFMNPVQIKLTPGGHLQVETNGTGEEELVEAFTRGTAHGLIALAARRDTTALPLDLLFWRGFADAYLTALAHSSTADAASIPAVAPIPALLAEFTLQMPAMPGAEYASPDLLAGIWNDLDGIARAEAMAGGGLKVWLGRVNPALHLLGRVTFHLAENKRSAATPFAFMATYTHRLSATDQPVHVPLGRALQEFAGASNRSALQSLLEPVRKAAESSAWTRALLESRRIFQPQAWTPVEAHAFLREIPCLEAAGILTRIPDWWRARRRSRPRVTVRIGEERGAGLGLETLLRFSVEPTLDGEPLTEEEWETLMQGQAGLVPLRGRWVEVDPEQLQGVMEHWRKAQAETMEGGVTFLEAMRMVSGVRMDAEPAEGAGEVGNDWGEVVAGGWLAKTLEELRQPGGAGDFDVHENLQARLRPYQEVGVRWLWLLQSLGLGACLADDMGLGKTIQVITVLLRLRHGREAVAGGRGGKPVPDAPALLVAPASLLANWKAEISRFAPSLRIGFAHPSESDDDGWRVAEKVDGFLKGKDLVITTYGQVPRLEWLSRRRWRLIVLDEAQAIKNPGSRQTRSVKGLKAQARIALTGTPVENRLGDLWSLFDFLNPGLLGKAPEFGRYIKRLQQADRPDFRPLRQLVRPYLLRRLKTDRSIVPDLPDKTEMTAWCGLAKRQAALYQRSVDELGERLEGVAEDGIQRRGLVLSFLMRLKQICNHPGHWLGDGSFAAGDSGKFQRLTEIAEEIASRQERVLVFTQFREMTGPLAGHLREVFGRPGLVLDGSTPVRERQQLVTQFQREDGPPFFVLSLKAGGTGLNLTAASQVIHFDRWWNPAVENQATDRAFRLGQRRNVLVHKFACRGTVEEKIDQMLTSKRELADSVLGSDGGPEKLLTEMSNTELIRFVSLDLQAIGQD
jgi:superfamily II DNA or RNA helicase